MLRFSGVQLRSARPLHHSLRWISDPARGVCDLFCGPGQVAEYKLLQCLFSVRQEDF